MAEGGQPARRFVMRRYVSMAAEQVRGRRPRFREFSPRYFHRAFTAETVRGKVRPGDIRGLLKRNSLRLAVSLCYRMASSALFSRVEGVRTIWDIWGIYDGTV